MICKMFAQAWIEGPSVMYVISKVFLVVTNFSWKFLLFLCFALQGIFFSVLKWLVCFRILGKINPHKPSQQSFCVPGIIYQLASFTSWLISASSFVFLFAKYMLALIVSLHKTERGANIPPSNCIISSISCLHSYLAQLKDKAHARGSEFYELFMDNTV